MPHQIADEETLSTSTIDHRFRHLFPFARFNIVQSRCFNTIFRLDDNLIVSAPTGSGKTVVFELAICRLIAQSEKRAFKVIYQAPTKSLCSERQRDWSPKFATLGLRTAELTGDSSNVQVGSIQHADIIITTPEKWDSITRKCKDHKRFVSMVKLFLIDEVQTLNDDRGAVLEAVVSRMKTITQSIRIVALSATIPYTKDICLWLGKSSRTPTLPAACETFEASVRPVTLSTFVHGYASNSNDYAFDRSLTAHIPDVIKKYSQKKPILIFCSTRAACVETAKQLRDWWWDCSSNQRLWSAPQNTTKCEDKSLKDFLSIGIAFHHRGLSRNDRANIERLYINGSISVLCCTSTLATGVNLPCHMVVIKGTSSFSSGSAGGSRDYADMEVVQMLGRAGRPQYGTTALAVIMTKREHVEYYKAISTGGEPIESRLHVNLIDHLNSEMVLGTVRDQQSAEAWLRSTFLYVRLKQNPAHYGLAEDSAADLDGYVKQICAGGIAVLQEVGLVATGPSPFHSTAAGEAMARFYIQFGTMKLFMATPPSATTSELLMTISRAAEFDDIFLRSSERQMLTSLDKSSIIHYPLNVYIDAAWQKIYLIVQCSLAGAQPPDATANQQRDFGCTQRMINGQIHRLLKCFIECLIYLKYSVALRNTLALGQSLAAGAWENTAHSMIQLESIGVVGVQKLTSIGIQTIAAIAAADPLRLDRAFSRHPLFGVELIKKAKRFPQLVLVAKACGEPRVQSRSVSILVKIDLGFLNDPAPTLFNGKAIQVCIVLETSDNKLLHYQRISATQLHKTPSIKVTAMLDHAGQDLLIHAMCESIAGTLTMVRLDVNIAAAVFQQAKDTPDVEHTVALQSKSTIMKQKLQQDVADDCGIADDDLVAMQDLDFLDVDDILNDEAVIPLHKPRKLAIFTLDEDNDGNDRKMPNGRWRCNHNCKNKSICKHLCCREGLDKPPKPSKTKPESDFEDTNSKPLRQTLLHQHGLMKKSRTSTPGKQSIPVLQSSASMESSDLHSNGKPSALVNEADRFIEDGDFLSSSDSMDIETINLVDMPSSMLSGAIDQPATVEASKPEVDLLQPSSHACDGMHCYEARIVESSGGDSNHIQSLAPAGNAVGVCMGISQALSNNYAQTRAQQPLSMAELARAFLGEQFFIFLES